MNLSQYSELQKIILRELYAGRYLGGRNFHSMSAILSAPAYRGKYDEPQFKNEIKQLVASQLVRTQAQGNDLLIDIPSYSAYLEIEKLLSKMRSALRYLSHHLTFAALFVLVWELLVHVAGHYIYHFLSGN